MHKNTEILARTPRGSFVRLWSSAGSLSGTLYQGILKTVNMNNDTAQLYNSAYETMEEVNLIDVTSIEAQDSSGNPIDMPEDAPLIDDFAKPSPPTTGWTGEVWRIPPGCQPEMEFEPSLYRTPPGTDLVLVGAFDGASSGTLRKGKLKFIDYAKNLPTLENPNDSTKQIEVPLDRVSTSSYNPEEPDEPGF